MYSPGDSIATSEVTNSLKTPGPRQSVFTSSFESQGNISVPNDSWYSCNNKKFILTPRISQLPKNVVKNPDDYFQLKKPLYAYFPNDQNRKTVNFGGFYKSSIREDTNWEVQILKNQRLRMMLRSLGKVAERYAKSVFYRTPYLNTTQHHEGMSLDKASKTKNKTNYTDDCSETSGRSRDNSPTSRYLVELYNDSHYCLREMSLEKDNIHTSAPKNLLPETLSSSFSSEQNELNKLLNDPQIRSLLEKHNELKHEKLRLQRRLCFQLEDRSVESKRRGFSRPLQYNSLLN